MAMSFVVSVQKARQPNNDESGRKARLGERLIGCRARFLLAEPFTTSLALQLNFVPVVDSRLQTACTDGDAIFFSVGFCEQLTDTDLYFLIAHEVWHCAANHFLRRENRDETLWNIAVDHEANAILRRFDISVPKRAVFFDHFDELSAEQVYEHLRKSRSLRVLLHSKGGSVQSFDIHNPKEGAEHPYVLEDPVFDPDYSPKTFSERHRLEWQKRLAFSRERNESQFGRLPGAITRIIDPLLAPSVPWNQLMRRYLQHCLGGSHSWLSPSRRHLYRGAYLPSRRSCALSVAVAIDTSGSTQKVLDAFISEVKGLLSEFDRIQLTLICCDSDVRSVRYFDDQDLDSFSSLPIHGGGGTDFRPVFRYLLEQSPDFSCLIYLTDGIGIAPCDPPPFPVLWVVSKEGTPPASWGESIKID